MYKFFVISLIISFLWLKTSGQGNDHYKVITWNIRLDTPHDGKNAWQYRKTDFCRQLETENADLIGFQEVLHNQLTDLQKCLSNYNHVGVGRSDGKTAGEYSPVFYKSERFVLIDHGTSWLSETPDVPGSVGWDAALERIVSWAKLKDRKSGDTLVVMNTHFDHIGQIARENSAALIIDLAGRMAPRLPLIVMGDFNADPENSAYQRFIQAGLMDARAKAGGEEAQRATYTGFDDDQGNDELIDFILHSNHFRSEEYAVPAVNNNGQYLSDHRPVVARLVRKR